MFRVEMGAVMTAIELGEHLARVHEMRRSLAFDGERGQPDVQLNLGEMKKALRAAIRSVETLEYYARDCDNS